MAWASILAGLIGAGGSVAGGVLGSSGGGAPDITKIKANDPLMNALLISTLTSLGFPVNQAALEKASPLGRLTNKGWAKNLVNLVNEGQAKGLSVDDIVAGISGKKLSSDKQNALDEFMGGKHFSKKNLKALEKQVAKSGYNSLSELIEADLAFSQQAAERAAKINEVQPAIEQGRLDALSKVAGLQSGFVSPTASAIDAQKAEVETALRAQIANEFARQREQALYEANAYGINPGRGLGELGSQEALANLAAGPDALSRTLQLLSGQQGLQSNALAALQGSLAPATTQAHNLLSQRIGQNTGAAQQALGLAQLQSNQNAILGQGVQGAAGNIAAIPFLMDEQKRARQRELEARINQRYGIASDLGIVMAANPDVY